MSRIAVDVAITNAFIAQGQIVPTSQVVSLGVDVVVTGSLVAADIATVGSNLATAEGLYNTATTDLGILTARIVTLGTDAAALQTDIVAEATQINVVSADIVTTGNSLAVVTSGLSTAQGELSNVGGTTAGLAALLNGQSFNPITFVLSGTVGASATLTVAQQQTLIANYNSLAGQLVTTLPNEVSQAILANDAAANANSLTFGPMQQVHSTLVAAGSLIVSDWTTLTAEGTTATTALTAVGTEFSVMSASIAIAAADIQTLITEASSSMYLVFDPTKVQNTAIAVQEFNAILNFLQTAGFIF